MSPVTCLKRARHLLAGGWSGPGPWQWLCRTRAGEACEWDAEEVFAYSVGGALRAGANDDVELLQAFELLEQVHHPALYAFELFCGELPKDPEAITLEHLRQYRQLAEAVRMANETYLDPWLERPFRPLTEVLRLFDLAILRATAKEAA